MKKSKTKFSSWVGQWMALLRTGVGLALLALSLVGLRLLWIHVQRPAHLEENAALWGSIRNSEGMIEMSHDGSRFIYVAWANDRGHALYLCDTLTGNKQQIIEDKQGVGIWNDDFNIQAGPWSPDDSSFLCLVSNRLAVFSGDTHQEKIVNGGLPFSEAVWLTPSEFVCVADKTNLCLAQKAADGEWQQKIFLSRNTPITSLTAIGSDTVVWLENSEIICRVNLSEDPLKGDVVPPVAPRLPLPPTNGVALWMDASKLRQPDQAQVMNLPDLSRNKNDAVWNGTPPIFNGTNSPLALNGKGTIHFGWLGSVTNGTGLKTRAPLGITGTAPRSVFVVMRHEGKRAMMVSMGDTSTHGGLFALEWSERLFLPTGWWADNYVDQVSTNWNLLEVVYDGSSQKGYLNGLLRCTSSAKLNTVERGMRIGFRDGSDAKAAEGDFAELLVYDRALNAIERQQVEDYMNAKWFGRKSSSQQGPVTWYGTDLDGMTGLTYSKERRELLISCTKSGRDSIWRLDTTIGPDASPIQVMQGQSMRNAQWAGPNQFVYASHLDTRNSLMLADLSGGGGKQLLQLWGHGSIEWFRTTPDQKQLFLLGSISNEPAPCIWRCDLASGAWHSVMSSSDYPSPAAQGVTTSHESMNAPGGNVAYTVFRPDNFDPHKKHPLMIGDTAISTSIYGEPFMKGVAACGAIVAVVDRPNWTPGLDQWAQNVQALYEHLKHDPTVDASRVYVFAVSAETHYLSQMVATNSAPWSGLILLNPSELPDFSQSPRLQPMPKILLDDGGEQHHEDGFKRFQKDALNSGVVVEYYLHPGETHRMVGSVGRLERVQEEMRFIFKE